MGKFLSVSNTDMLLKTKMQNIQENPEIDSKSHLKELDVMYRIQAVFSQAEADLNENHQLSDHT